MSNSLSERIGALSPRRLELLRAQLLKQGLDLSRLQVIPRADRSGGVPLSFAQQRLWLLDQLEPGGTAYNLPLAFQVQGTLDPAALDGALHDVAQRQEVLRTTFPAIGGRPVQVIHPVPGFSLSVLDLQGLPEERRQLELRRLRREEALRPFDLARGPLLRPHLVWLERQDQVLLLTMHHIISDHWSMRILVREVAAFYAARTGGQAPRVRDLPVQYSDFAAWQRQWLRDEELDLLVSYWSRQLAGAPTTLELPTDRPRGGRRTGRGAYADLGLPTVLDEELRSLRQDFGATSFMVLLAAFAALLGRSTGQAEVLVGSPIANRNREEVEGLIGFFVNSLVLRVNLAEDPSFRELVSQVRGTTMDAYTHQDLPFEKLVEELRPERSRHQNPLFQVVLTFQDAPAEGPDLPGVALRTLGAETVSAPFELTLSVLQSPSRLLGNVLYDSDLFDATTVARLAGHLRELLATAMATPDLRVSELPFQSRAELHQLLVEANDTASSSPDAPVHRLFAEAARQRPEAVALALGGEELSYGALDRRSDRLAVFLRSQGVAAETRVGIAVERSFDLIVCLLAVLKAGGAFVPLDPAYPPQRLAGMLEDAGVALLLGRGDALRQIAAGSAGLRVVACDAAEAVEETSEVLPAVDPGQLAYVMFTSGSTGRPKGVGVTHRSIVRLVRGTDFARFAPDEIFLQLAPTSFDASTLEIWGPLLNGGRLVLMSPGAPSLHDLGRTLIEHRITTLWLTAGLFHQMVDAELESLRGVRQLLAGGDTLSAAHVRQILDRLPGCRLINGYGPTENTTFTCCHPAASAPMAASVPIGRPIASTRVYVLDRALRPVPIGVAGELLTGGAGLARGYVNAPELTAEKMVPDPLGGEAGGRLYRTGDLVRWLADGRLEFLGRVDRQVKIRGFRIEIEEIEEQLRRHPSLREAAVLVRQDANGDKTLAAYVVPVPGLSVEAAELRGFLRERLPEVMIPSGLALLAELPLTENGKVDRRALSRLEPVPMEAGRSRPDAEAGPRNPVEELLAGIWSEVLAVESVGPQDDFFDLGGHSLKATQVVSRIRQAFGIELELRSLFEHPTVSGLAAQVEQALRGAAGGRELPPLETAPRDRPLQLSFAQQRLWFIDQLEPGSSAYNISGHLRLLGRLDPRCLAGALSEIVRRHESLRTTFTPVDGEPVQVIAPPAPVELPVIDLEALSAAVREGEALRLARQASLGRFDLRRGPLFRIWLVRCSESEHLVLSTIHHIVSDGWSMGILGSEIGALYEAFRTGSPAPLPALPIQYADFAAWQRSWLADETLAAELAWWRERLAGAPALLELPTDRPREAVQSFRGHSHALALPRDLSAALRRLGRREGSTLFMTLAAAFQVLLGRLAQTPDVSLGTPIAGRNRIETEGLIGFFVNTLVLRTGMHGEPPFVELLRRVRETVLGAYAHQDVPFEKLVEELRPERSLSFTPLFQVLFVLQNVPQAAAQVGDLQMVPLHADPGTAKFDLTLAVAEGTDRLICSFEHSADLFDDATALRWLRHWQALLESVVADPAARLGDLPLLREAERHQMLVEWNDRRRRRRPATFLALFSEQARRSPDAVVAECEGESLTYAELGRRAEALAGRLRREGVGPEVVVGLLAERGLDFLVAALGILRSGGAYLPLDPEHPPRRWLQVLGAARAPLVLAGSRWREPLVRELRGEPAAGSPGLLDLEETLRDGGAAPACGEALDDPDQLAYVIFTSGSTGAPKGAMVHRRGMLNHLHAKVDDLGLTAEDVVAQTASQCFDISVWQLLAPLLTGGRVAVFRDALVHDPVRLIGEVRRAGVSILELVPSFMRLLVEEMAQRGAEERSIPALRWFIPTGEALPPKLSRQWLDVFPVIPLLNAYGPTECSDDVSHHPIRTSPAPEVVHTPVGRPLDNTRLHVLDAAARPVPLGVAGELCVGGTGVGRGYLHEPGRTAEVFVPDPFAGTPGQRLYRTGDLARFLPAGELVFLGRRDHQVKVRGFRIELGEIEAVLGQCPGVRDAVVLARGEGAGRSLAAYVVPASERGLDVAALREALRPQLPEYMVPSAFVLLDALPLTPNGKVDRKALPEPARETGESGFLAPRTPVEEMLAGIWCEVLGLERVGVAESFFELGGHSLLATQVMSRLRRLFQVELPLRVLFESPTLAALGQAVEQARRTARGAVAPPIVPVTRESSLRLSFAQQRLWFLDRLEPYSPAYNIPVALRMEGALRVDALARSLGEVVRRHEALRTSFGEVEGEPVQRIAATGALPLPVVDLAGLPLVPREAEASRHIAAEALRPFDLVRGPLLRAALLRLGPEEHAALLTMHHIVSDGWSMQVLVEEVGALYAAFLEGRSSPLPELPLQYADYAAWQRSWLSGEVLEAELSYWRDQLAGLPPRLELPTDRPRPAVQTRRGATQPLALDPALSARLMALGRREGATPFMTLLAAWQALLGRCAVCEDLAVGTPIAGRNREETERLIGVFINTLVLRGDLAGGPSFRELVGRVRQVSLAAHEHQEVPFERLVEELAPERSLAHAPLFQVMFALQNVPQRALDLPGVRLSRLGAATETAKVDLTLSLVAEGGRISGGLTYNTDLFDGVTAERLLGCFATLLAGFSEEPDRGLPAVSLLDEAAHAQLLWEWNDTGAGAPQEVLVHELFERRVAAHPEALALVYEGEQIRYGELDRRAERLARRLRRLGVGPESRVALLLTRSAQVVVSLLGVLKAGGAYVPLDPKLPGERLALMLDEVGAQVLVLEEGLRDLLPSAAPAVERVVLVGGLQDLLEEEEEPAAPRWSGSLAYVLFTSGSTGRPKGVAIGHRQLANYVLGVMDRLRLPAGCSFATVSSFAADLGNTAVFPALCGGGCLHVVSDERLSDPDALGEYFRRWGVDCLKIVPSHLAALLSGADPAAVLPRRLLVLGGEASDWSLVRQVRELAPSCRVLNHYGPTETTVGVLTLPAWPVMDQAGAMPLGRPLPGSRVHVADRRLELVPVGVAGELVVGGAGVGRGYVGRPELTAERFVPDPFGGEPGGRLYRTGDLARWLSDGRLEFLGRTDDQVKIRGFRVEPGEVQVVLRSQPGVREAVVLARPDGGGWRLVAYVVPAGEALEVGRLRERLHERLPEHMVPSAFVLLERLPLTSNGKVDRKALPEPGTAVSNLDVLAPRTPVEEVLAGVWCEILGLEQVGVEEGFFELGGHSLLATQLVSRVRRLFGVELPLRDLFEAPTIAGLAARIEQARRAGRGALAPPIVPVSDPGPRRLSFAQQRLWFLDLLEPDSSAYNVPVALRVEGRLRLDVLERALGEVVRRHDALRTSFREVDGEPVQVVVPAGVLCLPLVDLSALPEPRRKAEASRLVAREALRPFDLSQGPLLRASLLGLGEEEHTVLLTLHHIVSDGWSMQVLVGEVGALYAAFLEGRSSPLPELPVQYADYAEWQRSWLSGEVLEAELSYWRDRLAGLPPRLELPTDRPRPAVQTQRGAVVPLALDPALSARLVALGRREGATPFMTLLAGWLALLGRSAGCEDLAVGTPIAGRNREETERLIGFFVNTLVLRGDLAGAPSFRELLGRVRQVSLEAHEHQEVPFERLVEELAPERSLSHAPLFQVMFVLQNVPSRALDLPGLQLSRLEVGGEVAKFDLTLGLREEAGRFFGSLSYNLDLFDGVTVERMLGHFRNLLAGASDESGRRLSELSLLEEAERSQLLWEWNDTGAGQEGDVLVHELFERQARTHPEALALICGDEQIGYGELDRRANRLAGRLRHLGAGPEVVVGVCLERRPELVVALLAVLKSGSAYLPLDPAYPPERLALMLEDSKAVVVVSRPELEHKLPGAFPVCRVDDEGTELMAGPSATREVDAENLAYLIYTSGSTGRPKGVAIRHRSAAVLLHWAAEVFGPQELSRTLAATSVSFDLSVYELFLPLSCGGTVVLADNALALPGLGTAVTLVNTVPSAMAELVRTGGLPRSVRTVNLAGEALPRWLVEEIYATGHVEKVYNLYGPSEDTTYSTFVRVVPGHPSPPSIGRPVLGTQVYVVGGTMGLQPVGAPGELLIGGEGLARGYLGRPDLTAERFVPDPFGSRAGERLYRTGDVVRRLGDGNLEFLGRRDHQVKVRGFRIELGEIEAALGRCPGVRDAVVLARGEGAGRSLAAYVVPASERGLDVAALREALRPQLPEYMVPSAFVLLDALPLTPNGKVDRKALPEPARETGESGFLAPRTPVEEMLAGIWCEVLGLERVGVAESFFELGGHSLLATQVMSRLRRLFQVELPLRVLFESPTLAALGQAVEQARRTARGAVAPPIVPVTRESSLRLSFAQQRLWFLDRLEPYSPAYNIPVALRMEGALRVDALARSLGEVVRRHEALRTSFGEVEGEPVQRIAATGALPLPVVDLAGLPLVPREAEASRHIAAEALRPFDLVRGPLLRAALLRLGPEEHAALLTMHHIVSDGWSMQVLVGEVGALYAAFLEGRSSPLPELPVQYADYAEWQRSWLSGEVLEAELSYWRDRLAGLPPRLELPTDRPRPAVQTQRGAVVPLALDPALSARLVALGRREGATPFMTLLAGWLALLGRSAGCEDLAVGTPIAGRNREETERLIGFFVNTLVLRGDLAGAPSFRELLGRVRQVSLEAHEHQEVPFERLVEELAPERSLSHAPLFQVMFVLQNVPSRALDLPGLQLSRLEVGGEVAKFDLTLGLREEAGRFFGSLSYNLDLFDGVTVERMLGHFRNLLAGASDESGRRLSELSLLEEAERSQLLWEWNDTGAGQEGDVLVHELFERQARTHPEALALICGDEQIGYGELDRRANRLAGRLRHLGAGPEVVVGVCLERRPELVVALLAVLKSGSAYLPLDPAYPPERLALMLEDSKAVVVVSRPELEHKLPGAFPVCRVDDEGTELMAGPSATREVDAENLAYLIYTSGSTGRPKGVAIRHRSAAVLLHWAAEVFGPQELSRTLAATSVSFDLSVYELFLPLSCGGTVVLADNALALPGLGTAVTLVNTVPSAMAELVRTGGLPRSVRTVNLAGEALPRWLVEEIYATGHVEKVYNLYGPSEDTTYSTFVRVVPGHPSPPSIGRPVLGTQVYVVGGTMGLQPVGAPGELLIGGEGLARGYLGRPDLTAERFVPDPFGSRAGERLYRTGDVVRRLGDGNLEFLGRRDHQVKVRGFRIELGEIEAALGRCPGVRDAVVLARGEGAGRSLAAYVVPAPESGLDVAALREALRPQLPEYMVPSAFVLLDALPLTPNGKLNRKALPAPDAAERGGAGAVAPRDLLELELAQLWEEVLGRGSVGVTDDFFELGGHSLLAVRLLALVRRRFGRVLLLADLFRGATVERLAHLLRTGVGAAVRRPLVAIRPEGEEPPFFWVHPVGGNVLCYADLARALGPGVPTYGFQSPAREPGAPSSIEEMAELYLGELLALRPEGPYRLGGWSMGGLIAFEMAGRLVRQGRTVERLALVDAYPPAAVPREMPDEPARVASFAEDLARTLGRSLTMPAERLRWVEDPLGHLFGTLQDAGLLPAGLDLEAARALYGIFRANAEALATYRPVPYPGRITLVRAARGPAGRRPDLAEAWGPLAGGIDALDVAADHYEILRSPHIETVACFVRAGLPEAEPALRGGHPCSPPRQRPPRA